MAKARLENFPVALRWLPSQLRRDLLALYGFARLADERCSCAELANRLESGEVDQGGNIANLVFAQIEAKQGTEARHGRDVAGHQCVGVARNCCGTETLGTANL